MSRRISIFLFDALVFMLAFILFFWLFSFTNFVHESGHVLFGFTDGLIKGQIKEFTISSWVKEPLTQLTFLPQQTRIVNGLGSLNFALGGPMLNMIVFFWLSFLGYRLSGKKRWFLLFISIFLYETFGNIICGTDNSFGSPLPICNQTLSLYVLLFAQSLFAGFMAFVTVRKVKEKILKKGA